MTDNKPNLFDDQEEYDPERAGTVAVDALVNVEMNEKPIRLDDDGEDEVNLDGLEKPTEVVTESNNNVETAPEQIEEKKESQNTPDESLVDKVLEDVKL